MKFILNRLPKVGKGEEGGARAQYTGFGVARVLLFGGFLSKLYAPIWTPEILIYIRNDNVEGCLSSLSLAICNSASL